MLEEMLSVQRFKIQQYYYRTFLPVATFFINETQYSNFRVLTSLSLCNSIHKLNSQFEALCLLLFYTVSFSLNGHHQVYKTVDEMYYSVLTLLYFA
jgi:hypothetical protein